MKHRMITAVSLALALTLMLLGLMPAALADQSSTDTFCSATTSGKHSWGEWKTNSSPTCTSAGSRSRTCGRCGYTQTESIAKTGHSWSGWKTSKEATCTANGEEARTCKACGAKETRKTDKKAHSWGKWTVTVEPTDFTMGTRSHTCKVCGKERAEDFYPDGTLKKGDKGAAVKALQEKLNTAGHDCGKADGDYGKKTEAAVKALEEAHGFTADGIAWPGVQKWLEPQIATYSNGASAKGLLDQLRDLPHGDPDDDDPLRIVTQPVGGIISHEKGESLTLTVEAAGGIGPYTFTWRQYLPWLDYLGTPELMPVVGDDLPSVEIFEGGMRYFCEVTDTTGARVRSESVAVDGEFFIVRQPANANLYGKDSVTLSCHAAGGDPFDGGTYLYAWCNAQGGQIGLSDDGVQEVTEEGEYYCMVQDLSDRILTTEKCVVYSVEPLKVAKKSSDLTLDKDDVRQLGVVFTGGVAPYEAVWRRGDKELETWTDDEGLFTTSIIGDGALETVYVCACTDAMGETAQAEVRVRMPKIGIAQQPKGGMLHADGTPFTLRVRLETSEAPYTCAVFRDGEFCDLFTAQDKTITWGAEMSGEYYFLITDARGYWVQSKTAQVENFAFHFEKIDVSGPLTHADDCIMLTAIVETDGTSVDYEWWWLGNEEAGVEETPMTYTGSLCYARMPGWYRCKATDEFGAEDTATCWVNYTGASPIIIQQPQSVTLGRSNRESDYDTVLSCRALNCDRTTANLQYQWQRKTSVGWVDTSETSPDLRWFLVPPSTGGNLYRCRVIDERNPVWKVYSQEVYVKIEDLYCSGAWQIDDTKKLIYVFSGGVAPYTVEVRRSGIRPEETDFGCEEIPYDEVYETLVFDVGAQTCPLRYKVPLTGYVYGELSQDGKTFRVSAYPCTWTVTVTDALGQTCSASVHCKHSYKVNDETITVGGEEN